VRPSRQGESGERATTRPNIEDARVDTKTCSQVAEKQGFRSHLRSLLGYFRRESRALEVAASSRKAQCEAAEGQQGGEEGQEEYGFAKTSSIVPERPQGKYSLPEVTFR
jgi:hypothetical protein